MTRFKDYYIYWKPSTVILINRWLRADSCRIQLLRRMLFSRMAR